MSQLAPIVPTKRPRAVKSCIRCQNKKLKCDREHPCWQCMNSKREYVGPEGCIYDDRPRTYAARGSKSARLQDDTHVHASPSVREANPSTREEMVIGEEASVRRNPPGLQMADAMVREGFEEPGTRSTRRRYHGISNTRSLIALFPDAVQFVNTALKTPELIREFQNLDRMFPKTRAQENESRSIELASISSLFPKWRICTDLMNIYWNCYEKIHRVLHSPTLASDYLLLKDNKMDDLALKRFIPQVALILALTSRMWYYTKPIPSEVSAIDPQKICFLVEHWLSGLSNKECVCLPNLQTYTLLIFAKQVILTPAALLWKSTGELVRLAMMGGLHQDPEDFGTQAAVSPSQVQAHRWLWYTIVELDVRASIGCCMPSLVGAIDYTCQVPRGVEDEPLTDIANSDRLGTLSSPQAQITLQIELSRSLPLRIKALNLLTKVHQSIDDVNAVLNQLEQARKSLIAHPILRQSTQPDILYTTILIDMCFRKPIIALYTLQVQRLEGDKDARLHGTARELISAAVGVMSHSDMLDPRLTDHESIAKEQYWIAFQAVHGDDLIRAATGACFALKVLGSPSSNNAAATQPDPGSSDNNWNIWPRNTVRRMVEEVIESMIRLTPDLRIILKQIMGLALTAELTKVHLDVGSKSRQMRSALNKVFKLCRERFEAENGNNAAESNDLESLPTLDLENLEDLLNSQFMDVDPFDFDWGVDPLPNINF